MKLVTHEGKVAEPVTADDIAQAVAGLTEVGEAFIILDDADGTYAQAAGTVSEEFLVEYRDGSVGEHYRGDRRVSASVLVALLVGYLHRAPDWKSGLMWHRVRVDQDPISA